MQTHIHHPNLKMVFYPLVICKHAAPRMDFPMPPSSTMARPEYLHVSDSTTVDLVRRSINIIVILGTTNHFGGAIDMATRISRRYYQQVSKAVHGCDVCDTLLLHVSILYLAPLIYKHVR